MALHSVDRLRVVSIIEGLSFLALLCVAMPVKYVLGEPTLVRYVGMVHGLLFILFVIALLDSSKRYGWNLKFSLLCFACSIVPFAPFWLENRLKKQAALNP